MTPDTWATYGPPVIGGLAALVVALMGGLLTDIGPWYRNLNKPSWQPPDWLFGPVWTVIFSLIATSGVLAWWSLPPGGGRTTLLWLFGINGVLNALWTILFFNRRRPDWALIELVVFWFTILAMILFTAPLNAWSAWLLVPYISWVTFAGILNATIVRLNAPFGEKS